MTLTKVIGLISLAAIITVATMHPVGLVANIVVGLIWLGYSLKGRLK